MTDTPSNVVLADPSGNAPGPLDAALERFRLLQDEAVGTGLRRIATEQIDAVLTLSGDDAVPADLKVHELRKCCKKMRGLLRLVRPLKGANFRAEDARFRAAARQLADDRDAEVIARTLAALDGDAERQADAPRPASPASIAASRDILSDCREHIERWPLDLLGFYDVAPGFARTYRACLSAWNTIQHDRTDERYHRLRRLTKYHWYQVCVLGPIGGEPLAARATALDALQTKLGDAHDLFVLETHLSGEAGLDEKLLNRAGERRAGLYEDARKIGTDMFATGVSELVAEIARYWADTRG